MNNKHLFSLVWGMGGMALLLAAGLAWADPEPEPARRAKRLATPQEENAVAGQNAWDETGPDIVTDFVLPEAQDETPLVAEARRLARSQARVTGASPDEVEQAAWLIPDDLDERKSEHQLALEAHAGEPPGDTSGEEAPLPSRRPTARGILGAPQIAAGKRVLGWHPYWATSSDLANYQFSNLTHLAFFSYEVNPANGNATDMHGWNTTPMVSWAHSNGVKAVLTVTLFGSANNQQFLSNPAATTNLIRNLLVAMTNRAGGAGDGVCIDFETIGSWSGSGAAMTSFMTNLIKKFHDANPNYEVSIALPAVDWSANFNVSAYNTAGMDYAIIMGYDYYYSGSSTPGPVAPLFSSAQWVGANSWCSDNYSITNYLGKGFPASKLMLGVPYYGRRWAAASTNLGAASLGSSYSVALTYGAAKSEANKYGRRWNDNASVPYYVYTSNSTAYQCFYDDTLSLGMKYDLANTKGLGGIGIWNLTQGTGQTELWTLIADKFGADAGPPDDPGSGDPGGSASAPWVSRTSAHTANFYGVGSRAGLHVASGAGGAIYTSTNGINWTARTSGKSGLLMNVNGDGPLWVIVGEGGAILTSTNGLNWVSRTSPTNALFRGVAYGNGIYVACGDGGAIIRSTNGITWSSVTSGVSDSLQGVGYGAEFISTGDTNNPTAPSPLFVVSGANGTILTSTNGVAWTKRTSGTTVYLSDVTYGNGYYVAVGNTRTLRSADGLTWSFTTNSVYLYRVAYCSGAFRAAGKNGVIWTSADGLTWSAETSGTTNDLRGMSYTADQFVSVGFNGTILTKGTMAGQESGEPGDEGGSGETGGGDLPVTTPDETGLPQVAAKQPTGPLSGVVVFTSAGHGFGANEALTAWIPERPLLNAVNEDMGNIDQLNYFAESAWKAGATVVPFRPVGYQTNEVVLDNMDTNLTARGQVTFGGTWFNSTNSVYYGKSGDAVSYRYAAVNSSETTAWATYRPNLPAAGDYPVYTWVLQSGNRTNQLYRIYHSGGVTDVRVDHSAVGCGWVWLGTYHFAKGTNGCVNISNYVPGGQEGFNVIADAIRFGNGMGTTARGSAGVSGFESELESSRFWVIKSIGQGIPSTLYDMAGYDDRNDNIGQPARMADLMCRTNDRPRWRRVYVGFHSNAGGGAGARGSIGLYDTRIQANYPSFYQAQTNLAVALARQCNEDMRAGVTDGVIPSWSSRTSYLYGSTYGELYNAFNEYVFKKMDTTINEVAFHDNADDCTVLKTPAGREWLARSSTRGLIKHLSGYYASGIINTNAPDRPIKLKAANSGAGAVTVSWAMPTRTAASGGVPQGFIIYTSTDGRGFGNPITVSGGATTSKTITNLNAGATIFFRVCATNAGGESLNSQVAGVRVTAGGSKAGVLVVAGFDRNDSSLAPTRYFANGLNGQVTLVRPKMINSGDYVKEHGLALAAAGQTFDFMDHTLVTGAAVLTNYAKVVWMLGEESTVDETFSSGEVTAVTGYLNAGGRLFVSGAEVGYDLGRAAISTPAELAFLTNMLRTTYIADSGNTGQVTGTASGFLNGVTIHFNYTNLLTDIYAANYPDVLGAGSGAAKAAVYGASAGGANGAIIQYSNATYRTIVMGFPFETITNEATRATVMTKAMEFLSDATVPGAVKVTLAPAGAAGTGRWIIANTTNTSGSTRTGLAPGPYQVTFGPVAGYLAPAATSIVVTAGTTNAFTATYTAASGALTVNLQPASAQTDGRWRINGGTWHTSGTTVSDLTNGTYAITYKDITSHTTPATNNVTISGSPVTITGTYVAQVGNLTVTLTPAAAVAKGAQWSVDGGTTWYNSGATATGLLAGRQYLTFKTVDGYTVPSTTYTTVTAGETVSRSYAYSAQPGSIKVNLSPAGAVATGAQWSLDGGTNWNESGATVLDLGVKTYTIVFNTVAGYTAPATISHALAAGENATLSAAYDEIQLVGADCIRSQGFDDLDAHPWSWSTIYLNDSGVTTAENHGAVVVVSTNKVLAGANGLRLSGSTNGAANPTILFSNVDISGYTNVTLTIPFAANGPDNGDDLHVAVSYNGGSTWLPSVWGTQIADGNNNVKLEYNTFVDTNRQPVGTPYVLAVDDSRTQIMVRVTFYDAISANTSDHYYLDEIQLKGQVGTPAAPSSAVKVTITPEDAIYAGAQWRVDAGAWRNSGTVVTGLTAGSHTVSFKSIEGWLEPADVVTTTTNSSTNALSAAYLEKPAGPVTIMQDDFEDGDLVGWTQDSAGNWANSTNAAITGNRSLKHNLSNVAVVNYVYAQPSYNVALDTTTWRFKLKNGNWDPSADNRFHVYLMASASDLAGTTVNGYAVGVNFTGTDDLIKLWRVTGGGVGSTVLTSVVDWNAKMTVAIEVTRTAAGLWELKTSTDGLFSGMTSAGTATDTTYTDTSYFGLYYKCTSTRAGEVWLDDVLIHQGELSSATDSDGDGMPDSWEQAHFGSATGADPNADADGDGMSNLAEYIAGTDPRSGNSVLELTALNVVKSSTTNLVIQWPSVTGRIYSIWLAPSATNAYTLHRDNLSGSGGTLSITNAGPAGDNSHFYGIKVRLAP
ncbi:MAG: putative sporulation-specific glycosylase YdhD [Verrucomicrobia bacterium ADurb.Bin018]|nr:MAG: putative sporulation-specific glycosylase YdhD [Verrucomicrobia bacterium ADurb.Bin018]